MEKYKYIMVRTILKIVPGKMAEVIKLLKEEEELREKYGAKHWRIYRCMAGRGGETMNTLFFDTDWDSFTEFENFRNKLIPFPETKALVAKWEPIVESHEMEFYTSVEL